MNNLVKILILLVPITVIIVKCLKEQGAEPKTAIGNWGQIHPGHEVTTLLYLVGGGGFGPTWKHYSSA